jgi:hypothetical protein
MNDKFFSLNWSIKLTSVVKIRECKYKSHVLKINVNIIKKKKKKGGEISKFLWFRFIKKTLSDNEWAGDIN